MCAFCVIVSSKKCVRSALLCLVKNRKLLTCTLNQDRVSMRMMMCIGPYTIFTRYFKDARYHEHKMVENRPTGRPRSRLENGIEMDLLAAK